MKSGVDRYLTGEALVQVHFPNGEKACKWCWPFLQADHELRRYRCKLTEEPLPDPLHEIGYKCPLKFQEKEE
jgi:hypothetical protein